MNDWHYCENCDSEFKVVSDNLEKILFCPFCSEDMDPEDDDIEDYWDDE
jgi:hypothetical protein